MTKKIDPELTISHLDLMPDDGNIYEIIEGELLVSKAPSLTHQRISRNVIEKFLFYLRDNPIGEILATPGVIFNNINGVIPDLVYLKNEIKDQIASGEKIK